MHLTFVSILQSLAFGILLVSIPLPADPSHTDFVAFVLQQHAYLAYIVSSVLILVIWAQYAQNSMFAIWPLSSGQLGLSFVLAVAEMLAIRAISQFGLFLIGLGTVGIVGGIIRLNNLRLEDASDYESAKLARGRGTARVGVLYIVSGLIVGAGGVAFTALDALAPNLSAADLRQVSSFIEWIALGALVVAAFGIAALDRRQRITVLRAAIENSDLTLTSFGVIRYRPDEAKRAAEVAAVHNGPPHATS
jgi:hypothetical protein